MSLSHDGICMWFWVSTKFEPSSFPKEKTFVHIWSQSSETRGRNYSVQNRPLILSSFTPFGPSSFISLDHPLTIDRPTFWPATIIPWDRPVSPLWAVQFHFFRPSTHISRDRLVSSLRTDQLLTFRPSLSFVETVQFHHFRISGPFTFADRQLSVFWTVQFNTWPFSFSRLDSTVESHRLFTLIQDRPL